MEKTRRFERVYFDANTLKKGIEKFNEISKYEKKYDFQFLSIWFNDESWLHDNLEEFYSDFRKDSYLSTLKLACNKYRLEISTNKTHHVTDVTAAAPTRQEIEMILELFENSWKMFYEELTEEEIQKNKPIIFIGHGRNAQWKDLKDHLHEKHSYQVEFYEIGERAGHTIRDVLESMLVKSSFAILVMTGEDKFDEQLRARQNVIHEVGLFQGRLGFNKAIVLLEEGTEEFSNIHGINQIRYKKNSIKETFGDVLAVLKREFNN